MNELAKIWQKIADWYSEQSASHLLAPPASLEQISAAEQALGLAFPPELRQSLQYHNGSLEGGWPAGELLSLEGIASERKIWLGLLQNGTFANNADHNAVAQTVRAGWWQEGWLPLTADGGGNGYVVDSVPASGGAVGQVLFMDHETGPSEAEFTSLADYLAHVAQQLTSGKYVLEDDWLSEIESG